MPEDRLAARRGGACLAARQPGGHRAHRRAAHYPAAGERGAGDGHRSRRGDAREARRDLPGAGGRGAEGLRLVAERRKRSSPRSSAGTSAASCGSRSTFKVRAVPVNREPFPVDRGPCPVELQSVGGPDLPGSPHFHRDIHPAAAPAIIAAPRQAAPDAHPPLSRRTRLHLSPKNRHSKLACTMFPSGKRQYFDCSPFAGTPTLLTGGLRPLAAEGFMVPVQQGVAQAIVREGEVESRL